MAGAPWEAAGRVIFWPFAQLMSVLCGVTMSHLTDASDETMEKVTVGAFGL